MKTCPSPEQLLAFAAGHGTADDLAPTHRHIDAGCASCEGALRQIETMRSIARSDALLDPPAWVTSRAAGIPRLERASRWSDLAAVVASLVFDSVRDPLAHGARSAPNETRQMLYRADEYDIDIRISPEHGDTVRITGQILPSSSRPLDDVAGLEVALASDECVAETSTTNELGEFDFGSREAGDYSLWVGAPDQHLIIGGLPARAS